MAQHIRYICIRLFSKFAQWAVDHLCAASEAQAFIEFEHPDTKRILYTNFPVGVWSCSPISVTFFRRVDYSRIAVTLWDSGF